MIERPAVEGDAADPGDVLSAAVVDALRSTAAVRSAADAVELQAIATLATVRRSQAHAAAERREAVRRREHPGTPRRKALVDLDLVDRCTAQEVSLALWLSPVVARDRLQLALELVEDRPATFDALRGGSIDLVRARRIVDAVRPLQHESVAAAICRVAEEAGGAAGEDPAAALDAASAVEAEALYPGSVDALADLRPGRPAAELTPAQLTARLGRLVLRAAPGSAMRRTEAADARRSCSLRVLPDGMGLLSVTGRMELLGAAFSAVDSTARALLRAAARDEVALGTNGTAGATSVMSTSALDGPATADEAGGHLASGVAASDDPAPGDGAVGQPTLPDDAGRSLDRTRVDVLLARILGHSSDLAQAPGVRVQLSVVAPSTTVLGGGDEPGEVVGLGPVPAPLVRELAADAAWVRWVSDPQTGQVTDVGRRTYRPSAAVADLVRARDAQCRFPTCRRAASACDLDHVVPFPDGATEAANLGAECRTHHLTKHRGGFRVRIDPDGTFVWTTPTGGTVRDPAPSWGRSTVTGVARAGDSPTGVTEGGGSDASAALSSDAGPAPPF